MTRSDLLQSKADIGRSLDPCFALLDEAYEEHNPSHVFCLLSGGHDSMTATAIGQDWAKARGIWSLVAHVNTGTGIQPKHVEGLGIKDTHTHVLDTCEEQGWELIELHPPVSYRTLVLQMGFPGPGFHDRLAYPRLKDRCFRNLERMAPEGRRVMFITGIRQQESERRIAHVERIQLEGSGRVWAAPIWDWEKSDCNAEIARREMPRNQVSDLIHVSGECLCGAMARKNELNEIAQWIPLKAQEIRDLEDEVEAAGLRACRYGVRPPKVAREQMKAFLMPNSGPPMACAGCAPLEPQEEAA